MRVAFADFDVSFQHAIQGIHGPSDDRDLLAFLAAYLRSPLARYFLFHATAHWGVERSRVHLVQLLTAPFPLPEETRDPQRSREIVAEVAARVRAAAADAAGLASGPINLLGEPERREIRRRRARLVEGVQSGINELVYDYFDIAPVERILIEDTNQVIIPSTRPSHASERLPTLKPTTPAKRQEYRDLLCRTLNDWADGGPYRVSGYVETSPKTGMGVVVLERHPAGNEPPRRRGEETTELIPLLTRLRAALKRDLGSVEMLRGLKVFDRDQLYLIKPLAQRFWTKTAALNDADDIAATILMQHGRGTH
jgi:hypothetical protein